MAWAKLQCAKQKPPSRSVQGKPTLRNRQHFLVYKRGGEGDSGFAAVQSVLARSADLAAGQQRRY